MTWFRAEAGIARHEIIGALAEALKVRLHEAAGLYVFTLAGFADFQVDGDATSITDTTLEQWALWRGRPGRFAAIFRRLCVEDRESQQDGAGVVRGWWRQEALLREQQRSRTRPGQGTRATENPREGTGKAPEKNRVAPAVPSRGNEDEDEDVNEELSHLGCGIATEPDPIRYTQRCTAAANRGLRENPMVTGFNELVSSNQDEPPLWQGRGVPLEVAEGAIYQRARAYRPKPTRRQPSSLGYFRQAVEDEWARAQGRALEGGVNVTPPPASEAAEAIDEYERLARKLEREELPNPREEAPHAH